MTKAEAICCSILSKLAAQRSLSKLSGRQVMVASHSEFTLFGSRAIRALGKPDALLYDVEGVLAKSESFFRL